VEDVLVRGPLQPERALEELGRAACAPGAAVDRSGTPLQYLSPEQLLGGDGGERSEVYSLSALLYQYLTGSPPFPQGGRRAVLFWHLHAPRPRPTAVRPELPAAVDEVVARGMTPDPAGRHPTADALLEHARQALETAPVAPPREPVHHGRRRRWFAPLAAGMAVAAGALGFAVAGALDDPPPRTAVASAGSLGLTAPAAWRPSRARASLFGVPLADPVALAPDSGAGGRVVAGIAPPGATVALLTRLRASPRAGEPVALERMQARRYDGVRDSGLGIPAVLYVTPVGAGLGTVACLADDAAAARSFMPRCERVAASLRVASSRSGPAAPSGAQVAGLRRVLEQLNAARSAYRSQLARARTATQQATAARTLAGAHVRAQRSLGSLELSGLAQPGGRAATDALARSAAAYQAAARAAGRRRAAEYARARRSALAADASLRRGLQMLRVVGYAG
jgi:hypothetical protein